MRKFTFVSILLIFILMTGAALAQDDAPAKTGFRPDAPPYGVRGPYSVGVMDTGIENPDRPLPVRVWYPADAEDGDVSYIVSGEWAVMGKGTRDAAPDTSAAPYPLVIYSHGLWGTNTHAIWLNEHLASQGFVVMAPQHIGSAVEEYFMMLTDPDSLPTVIDQTIVAYGQRPLDIPLLIDFAETLTASDGALASLIDLERVAVGGHSFGGYTALAAGGGQFDLDWLQTWCAAHPDEEVLLLGVPTSGCVSAQRSDDIAAAAGLDSTPVGLWPSLGDPRVDAVIALAPGMVLGFGDEGLANVSVPALVMTGSRDIITIPENHAYRAYETLGSASKSLVVFANGDHTLFHPKSNAALTAAGFFPFFSDPVWDMDRAHDIANHLTTAFLLDVLKGDAEAHAALLAENVSFPGITYETTMK